MALFRGPVPRAGAGVPAGLGTLGTYEFVEPHVRRLVAEHLGVGLDDLVSDVSLRDDLAADSLDLLELVLALEGEFAIEVADELLGEVRTYGNLVQATVGLIRARRAAETRGAEPLPRIWVRVEPPAGDTNGTLDRTGWLTPYVAETIVADAARAGRGARVDVTIAASTPEGFVRAERWFAALARYGVSVTVRRDDRPPAPSHRLAMRRTASPPRAVNAGA